MSGEAEPRVAGSTETLTNSGTNYGDSSFD